MSSSDILAIFNRSRSRFSALIEKYEAAAEEDDDDDEGLDLSELLDSDFDEECSEFNTGLDKCRRAALEASSGSDDDELVHEGECEEEVLGYFSGRFLGENGRFLGESSQPRPYSDEEASEDDECEEEPGEEDEDNDADVLVSCGDDDCVICRAKAMYSHKPIEAPLVKQESAEQLRRRPVVVLERLVLPVEFRQIREAPHVEESPLPPSSPEISVVTSDGVIAVEVPSDHDSFDEIRVVECRVNVNSVKPAPIDDRIKTAIRRTYQENRAADPDSFVDAVLRKIYSAPAKEEPLSPEDVKKPSLSLQETKPAPRQASISVKRRVSPVMRIESVDLIKRRVLPMEPKKEVKTEPRKASPLAQTTPDSDDEDELENYFPCPSFSEAPADVGEEEQGDIDSKPLGLATPIDTSKVSRKRSRRKVKPDWKKELLMEKKREENKKKKNKERKEESKRSEQSQVRKKDIRKKVIEGTVVNRKIEVQKMNDDENKVESGDDDYFSRTFNFASSPENSSSWKYRLKHSRNCATEVKKRKPKPTTRVQVSLHDEEVDDDDEECFSRWFSKQ